MLVFLVAITAAFLLGRPEAGVLLVAASPAVLLALGFDVRAQRRGDPT
jgi:hypothetical protein